MYTINQKCYFLLLESIIKSTMKVMCIISSNIYTTIFRVKTVKQSNLKREII